MKSLTALFADLTQLTGWFALFATLVYNAYRAIKNHAEMKIAKAAWKTLQLQSQLGKLSAEREALDNGINFASGLKMQAATLAYDRLLLEACERAGIDAKPQSHYQDVERLRRERALNQLGWVW